MQKIGRWLVDDRGWGLFWPIVFLMWFLVIVPFLLIPGFLSLRTYEIVTGKKVGTDVQPNKGDEAVSQEAKSRTED